MKNTSKQLFLFVHLLLFQSSFSYEFDIKHVAALFAMGTLAVIGKVNIDVYYHNSNVPTVRNRYGDPNSAKEKAMHDYWFKSTLYFCTKKMRLKENFGMVIVGLKWPS